jgi:hypothetical protein
MAIDCASIAQEYPGLWETGVKEGGVRGVGASAFHPNFATSHLINKYQRCLHSDQFPYPLGCAAMLQAPTIIRVAIRSSLAAAAQSPSAIRDAKPRSMCARRHSLIAASLSSRTVKEVLLNTRLEQAAVT